LNNKARGGQGDAIRTLAICNLVVDDREEMVVKALSWSLRELAKRDRRSVKNFLDEKHTHLSPRVVREVNNKLKTGLKNPRKS
jgi:3-methyladenine DNA glycosylase AlkD